MRFREATLLFSLTWALTFQAAAQTPMKTVLDGVYTTAQAERGLAVYGGACRRCHQDSLLGSPEASPLITMRFVDRWREDNLQSLLVKMKNDMPPSDTGFRLSEKAYTDIIAFLLQQNEYPAGPEELKIADLPHIQFVGKDGPQPVPNQAQVLAVGCLEPGPNSAWTLTRASEPVRTRTPEESSPEELKASEAKPLGALTFQLRSLDNLPATFSLDAHKGQKVQIEGVLSRLPAGDRINVMSMAMVSAACK